jgi:hypothetical protein
MPFLGLGLHVVIALCFAVHVVRSGQDRYWLMVLFMFPLLGSVVYAVAIWLPELRYTEQGRALSRGVKRLIDPGRELREAQDDFDTVATVEHRLRLADALVGAGRPADAIEHYRACLRGIHDNDPDIQVRLSQALLESGQPAQARRLLDELIRRSPEFRSQLGHLTYARAVAGEGDRAKAREEFETLVGYASGFDAHVHYAEALIGWDERERALGVCENALKQSRRLPAYSRRMNKPALERLKQLSTAR